MKYYNVDSTRKGYGIDLSVDSPTSKFKEHATQPLLLTPCPPGYNLQVVGGELLCVLEGAEDVVMGQTSRDQVGGGHPATGGSISGSAGRHGGGGAGPQ